jgi:hypothetical protein
MMSIKLIHFVKAINLLPFLKKNLNLFFYIYIICCPPCYSYPYIGLGFVSLDICVRVIA